MAIAELRRQRFAVVATDLDSRHNRRIARGYAFGAPVLWGDIRHADFAAALHDVVAVIHLAAVLPPGTENAPTLAREINVDASVRLIETMERVGSRAVFIYPSSVTVYGPPSDARHIHRSGDPTRASDNYTAHKLEVEVRLMTSQIAWTVLRVGVSVDARTLGADAATLRKLFHVAPDNPLEYVHPRDVARAMVNAISRPDAWRKVLLIGGGESCRVTQHAFLSAALGAIGVTLPRELLGTDPFYTGWMDTAESQRLLDFQHHSFADYRNELRHRLRWVRLLLTPFRSWVLWTLRRSLEP